MEVRLRIYGATETRQRLKATAAVATPAQHMLVKWGTKVERGAKRRAPRDKAHLRRSLTHEVDSAPMPLWVRAGTNLAYAPSMEGGTGLLADLPGGTGRRHWPPWQKLDEWARRKQIVSRDGTHILTGKDIARIIGLRGGLRPRRFLRDAAKDAEAMIPTWIKAMAREIQTEATRGANR